jgi:adenosine deaminase CECR1
MIAFYDPNSETQAPPAGLDFRTTAELRDAYPDGSFNTTMRNLLTVDGSLKNLTSRQAWAAFQPLFIRSSGFMAYRPAMLAYLYNTFEIQANDNVQHVEIRAAMGSGTFGGLYDLNGNTFTGTDVVVAYEEALDNFQNDYQYPKYAGGNFSMKLIVSTLRVLPSGEVEGDLENAFILKQAHPDTVRGFDAVSEEDTGNTTVSYLSVWETIPQLERQYQVTMPFFFHDGESDTRNNTNLIDAVLLGSHRIGHGVNAFWMPRVREELKFRKIPLEICPLSNQILRYVDNIEIHPGGSYIMEGLPVVISSDDPGIFGYTGMTYDFWVAAMAWRLDLRALKVLAMNSLEYSTLTKDEKSYAMELFNENWNAFVKTSLDAFIVTQL